MNSYSEARAAFKKKLSERNLPLERFAFGDEDVYSTNVSLNETWFAFSIKSTDPFSSKETLDCYRYPYPIGRPYKIRGLELADVITEFENWIDSIETYLFTKTKGEKHLGISLPRISLNSFEQNLLSHLYKEFQNGTDLDPLFKVLARLYPSAPSGFEKDKVLESLFNVRLITRSNEITPYGIWNVEADSQLLDLLDEVIIYIKNRIMTEAGLSSVYSYEVEEMFLISKQKALAIFRLLRELGGFMKEIKEPKIEEISVSSEKIYKRYLEYTGLQKLIGDYRESPTKGFEEPIGATEAISVNLIKGIFESSSFTIRDTAEVEPVLGVKQLAQQVVEIIKNLRSEPGNMIGIFGSWGRGKTFLINQILQLVIGDKSEFEVVRFHAWRYQDTPASWAYLYERFSEEYLGDKKIGLRSWFRYHLRLWNLNVEREGKWRLRLGVLSLFGVSFVTLSFIPINNLPYQLLWVLGFPFVAILIKKLNLEYFSKAVNLIKKYGVKTSFKDNLGIQAEIQKELIYLINAWTRDKGRKIILFVDDLDRCKEEKSLEIIDSLRIILDDGKITEKLFVIAAIDQKILSNAVSSRYSALPEKSELQREYIDKLFIFSLKLSALGHNESQEFFEALIKNDKHIVVETHDGVTPNSNDNKSSGQPNPKKGSNLSYANIESGTEENSETTSISTTIEKIQKLTKYEISCIKEKLAEVANPTPRRIRILYYRYLFARNLLIEKYSVGDKNPFWLTDPNLDQFVSLLIFFSQSNTDLIGKEIERVKKLIGSEVDIKLIGGSVKVSKSDYVNLLRVLELVIAY
jgi:hypothetical protein